MQVTITKPNGDEQVELTDECGLYTRDGLLILNINEEEIPITDEKINFKDI